MRSHMKDTTMMILIMMCSVFLATNAPRAADMTSLQSTSQVNNIAGLSKPEHAIDLFVKAFRVGDDAMLSAVLFPHAAIPEFNPLQKIECPSPELTGFNITKSHVVTGNDKAVAYSQQGDIEAHVLLKFNKKNINKKCLVALWEKGVYVLRNTSNGWLIIAIIPFWPEDVEHLSK